MSAYGAELIEVENIEVGRDLLAAMAAGGEAYALNQYDNPDNADSHYASTGACVCCCAVLLECDDGGGARRRQSIPHIHTPKQTK